MDIVGSRRTSGRTRSRNSSLLDEDNSSAEPFSLSPSASNKFEFSDPIIPSPTNPISNKTLSKRLSKLHEQLTQVDQDVHDEQSLTKIAQKLVNPKLIKHKDTIVQSLVALCIAEILKIFAPRAPYNESELTKIFQTFFGLFKVLKDGVDKAPNYQYVLQLIQRLVEVRSIVLITDISKSEGLITSLFDICYNDIGKSLNCTDDVVLILADILSEIIGEAASISQKVLTLILTKFLTNAKTSNNGIDLIISNSPGFKFSLTICQTNPERMSRQIAQFFSEQLYENLVGDDNNNNINISDDDSDDSSEQDSDSESSDKRYKEFKKKSRQLTSIATKNLNKIHRLIEEIWKFVPEILSSVMGLIDAELAAENDKIRVLATQTIGNMIKFQPSKLNFITSHEETWLAWSKKILDSLSAVRSKWVTVACEILTTRFDLVGEIANGLVKALIDTDDKVRLNAVKSIGTYLTEILFLGKFVHNVTILTTISQLSREKNIEIRNECIKFLSKLYSLKFQELLDEDSYVQKKQLDVLQEEQVENEKIQNSSSSLKKLIGWIPDHLISLIYINAKNINSIVDLELVDSIFTLDLNSTVRVKRLCYNFSQLSKKSRIAFQALNNRQVQLSNGLLQFLELIEQKPVDDDDDENSLINKKLNKTMHWIASGLPDEYAPLSCLEAFVDLGNKRLIHLLKLCISSDSSLDTIKNSMKEFFGKIKDPKINHLSSGDKSNLKQIQETWKLLIYRCSVIFYNKSNINTLIQFTKDNSNKFHKPATELVEEISLVIPGVFESHIEELTTLLCETAEEVLNEGIISDGDTTTVSAKSSRRSLLSTTSTDNNSMRFSSSKKSSTITNRGPVLINTLKTLYHFFSKFPKYFPNEYKIFLNTLGNFSLECTPLEAKYTIKIICLIERHKGSNYVSSNILSKILPLDIMDLKLPTHLLIISELFLYHPRLMAEHASDITAYVIKEVLLRNNSGIKSNDDGDEEMKKYTTKTWITDEELEQGLDDNCYSKIMGLRVFVNRLVLFDQRANLEISVTDLANMVLKLLISCISNGGELVSESDSNCLTLPYVQARVRLTAGLMLLKLSKLADYNKMLKPKTINRLVFLIQDENAKVRAQFIEYLQRYLNNESISQRYLPLIFFTAHEPDYKLLKSCETWIRSSFKAQLAKTQKLQQIDDHHSKDEDFEEDDADEDELNNPAKFGFERAWPRFIHMLAHHQEFIELVSQPQEEVAIKAYVMALKYIMFYLNTVVTRENISLVYYLTNRTKQYRDALVSAVDYQIAEHKHKQQNDPQLRTVESDNNIISGDHSKEEEKEEEEEEKEEGEDNDKEENDDVAGKKDEDGKLEDNSLKRNAPIPPSPAEYLYQVAELAILAINHFSTKKNWMVTTYPGKLRLPKDLFSPMKSSREAQRVASKSYIPNSFLVKLDKLIRVSVGLAKQSEGSSSLEVRRRQTSAGNKLARKQKKQKRTDKKEIDDLSKRRKLDAASETRRRSLRTKPDISYKEEESESEDSYHDSDTD